MLKVLPELHDPSSIPAASLLLHILAAAASPGQTLQAAEALLTRLPLYPHPSASPSASQIQLACEILGLFTAEAFQALSKGRSRGAKGATLPVDGLEVLLDLLRFGLDGHKADGQKLAEKVRLAAFQRLGAELYAVMPVRQQLEAFLVSSR